MKPLMYGLLGVSLAGNVALLALAEASATRALATSRHEANSAHPNPAAVTAPALSASTNAVTTPMRWPVVTDLASLHALVAQMRAAGFPARTTFAVVNRLFDEYLATLSPYNERTYWQMPTGAQLRALREAGPEKVRARAELMAAIGRPSELLDPLDRERRYGNLPDEKVDELEALSADYARIQSKLRAGSYEPRGAPGANDRIQQMFALKAEQKSDAASLLTPEELEAYELRQSDSARRVARSAQEMALSEAEFAALYRLDKQFVGDDLPGIDPRAHELRQKRQANQPEYYAQLRTTLGEERFYTYLTGLDSNYSSIRQLAQRYPTLTPQVSYQVLQLAADVRQQLAAIQRTGSRADLQAAFVTIHARLETLVGRDAALALRQSAAGGIFKGPSPSAAPAGVVPPRN